VTGVDGLGEEALARAVGAPRVEHHESIGSTMDRAHQLAELGAPSGTIVVADEQIAGRGRHGRKWSSARGQGLWLTVMCRAVPVSGLDVLSIRIGLELAPALDPFATGPVGLKWPNDLLVAGRKLGGVLVEARWRDVVVEWVAVGVGVNLVTPEGWPDAAALRTGSRRSDVLRAIFHAVVSACSASGDLTSEEMQQYGERDAVRDVLLAEPAPGYARGITSNGALIVETEKGRELFRRGSFVRAPEGQVR
jgi:BirA family biotin operon repressor/biotin-[acetyl-CoA-carboxylase] ligase